MPCYFLCYKSELLKQKQKPELLSVTLRVLQPQSRVPCKSQTLYSGNSTAIYSIAFVTL